MMIRHIDILNYRDRADDIADMHRLRHRVFKERLDWKVSSRAGMEVDTFDQLNPDYLLYVNSAGKVEGCVRLLPTTGSNMLRDVFPGLLDGRTVPSSPSIWESSRFALDLSDHRSRLKSGVARGTSELFLGMIEFGLSKSLVDIVTVTDLRMERILRRAGWPLRRIAEPRLLDGSWVVAGYLEVSAEALTALRLISGIQHSVLEDC